MTRSTRSRAPRPRVAALLAIVGLCAQASAQLFEDLDEPRPTADPVAPATPDEAAQPVPGLTGGQDWFERVRGENLSVETASRLAEGTFLIRRPGTLVSVPSGHRVWVPTPETRLPGEGAMLLVPCQTLARMDASLGAAPDHPVLISGEVFAYHGHNYLLPTAFARAAVVTSTPEPTPDSTTDTDPTDPQGPSPQQISDNPEIDELMKSLDDSLSARGLAVPSTDIGATRAQPSSADLSEGSYLTRRRGRLIRGATGAWTVAFDNDTDSSTQATRPMVVVPCRLLMQLEKRAQRRGDQLALTVSGRVYAYGDTNYLVPTLMQENTRSGIDAHQ